jgi:D-tyrosyl-tRNA(Tyr) deacylase
LCPDRVGPPLTSEELVVVISEEDPVARAVSAVWGGLPSLGDHIDGVPLRRLNARTIVLGRPGRHIHDEGLDRKLPAAMVARRPTILFPSIHRSEQNVPCLTVHPLGNPGPRADVGGRPRTFVPADPRRMAKALRLLDEGAASFGMRATFEATHHGPALDLPAFFVEIGYGPAPDPPSAAVQLLARIILEIEADPSDHVAFGVGGGHYVPHFSDLVLRRRWAFGHLISRHALAELDRATAAQAYAVSGGAEGVVYARAEDARHPALEGLGPRLRDSDAPPRGSSNEARPITDASRSASGT